MGVCVVSFVMILWGQVVSIMHGCSVYFHNTVIGRFEFLDVSELRRTPYMAAHLAITRTQYM